MTGTTVVQSESGKNCRRAMGEKGRVLLVDRVVPDNDAMSFIKLLDLNMLAMTEGRERSKAEFRALLDAAVTS